MSMQRVTSSRRVNIVTRRLKNGGVHVRAVWRCGLLCGCEITRPFLPNRAMCPNGHEEAKARADREVAEPAKKRVYLIRPSTHSGWLYCPTPAELQRQIDEIADEDEVAEIDIEVRRMSQAEIDALPEFGGW